jgi:hypothetical protein
VSQNEEREPGQLAVGWDRRRAWRARDIDPKSSVEWDCTGYAAENPSAFSQFRCGKAVMELYPQANIVASTLTLIMDMVRAGRGRIVQSYDVWAEKCGIS